MLVAVAATVSADEVQAWLFEHPRELYYGVSFLHLIAFPLLVGAVVAGYGKAEADLHQQGSTPLVWATVLFFACSFIVPGVLGLALDQQLWVMMTTIFGPFVLLVALAEVGLPMGVLLDYVPVRVMLYYVRDASRWEALTIVASTLHLLYRLGAA